MNPSAATTLAAVLVALAVIASATVAVVTGHIGEQAYVALIASIAGAGIGAGAHAAGTASAPTVTATTGPPAQVRAEPQ